MDESNRLKPFSKKWDQDVFTRIFRETEPLRRKCASLIDARRFGVDYEEILSWFDVKFLWAYSQYMRKYDTEDEGKLKGYCLMAVNQYKHRIMRKSYQDKYKDHASILDITELYNEGDIYIDEPYDHEREEKLTKALDFMKKNLSDDAYFILEIELNPPGYILKEMEDLGKTLKHTIPNDLILEYLDWPNNETTMGFIKSCRAEIREVTKSAAHYFQN